MVRSHKHGSAVYYKYWSEDPKEGRTSIVKVFNKKMNKEQFLPVDKIGLQKDYYLEDLELFFSIAFESKHDEFMDTVSKIDEYRENFDNIKDMNPLIFNLILRSPYIMDEINKIYQDNINIINSKYPNRSENEPVINAFKEKGFQLNNEEPNIRKSRIFKEIHSNLANARIYPILIRKIHGSRLITCDNPVLLRRIKNIGTIYYITLNPQYYMCLGFYAIENNYDKMLSELNRFEISPVEINKSLESQAQTFFIL